MIAETTEIGAVAYMLAAEGLSIVRVESRGGLWHCTLRVLDPYRADRADGRATGSEGSGPTLASAIEDARVGWVQYRDRYLSTAASLAEAT